MTVPNPNLRNMDKAYVDSLRPDLKRQVDVFLACGFTLDELVMDLKFVRKAKAKGGRPMQGAVVPRIAFQS